MFPVLGHCCGLEVKVSLMQLLAFLDFVCPQMYCMYLYSSPLQLRIRSDLHFLRFRGFQ